MELKRIMVGLDLTEMDEYLIQYVNLMETIFDLDMVYFLHVSPDLMLPERIREKYPDIMAPVDESLASDIQHKLDLSFRVDKKTEYKIEILEGQTDKAVLRWTQVKNVDLIVMGRKLDLTGSGKFATRFARLTHCSTLFVPERMVPNIASALVSVDFSNTSGLALEAAMYIREYTPMKIVLHHAYEIPSGYHYTGKTYEEFKLIMEKNAMEDAYEFVEKRNLPKEEVTFSLTFDEEADPGERAFEAATAFNTDLIIIASRGRTGLASLLLGSVAEKMVQYDATVPLLIIKDKKENLGLFDALLRI